MNKIRHLIRSFVFALNRILLKMKYPMLEISKTAKIDMKTKININSNKLIIGKNVHLRSNSNGYHAGMPFSTCILLDGEKSFCEIGDNCRINGSYIHAKSEIIVGKNTVIAAGTNIIDSNGHLTNSEDRTMGRDVPQPICIGDNVWIGLNCLILKGTTIGDNSVVSAGSIVKGNFPRNSIIQGNPAKHIKTIGFKG